MTAPRMMPIDSDTMEPTFMRGRHLLAVAPIDHYDGEGVYVLFVGGLAQPFRVTCAFGGRIAVSRDNVRYGTNFCVSQAEFEEAVLGKVVGHFEALSGDARAAISDWLASRSGEQLPGGLSS